jgi:23S rRNA (cytidine1920-2'-O)/16S rRNA (cytidine1409-2'-O)-methyltransferase
MKKIRADGLVLARGLAASRSQAQALIMAGQIVGAGKRIDKPGALLLPDAELTVLTGPRFVSRGGEKLDHALDVLEVTVEGLVCVDIGASTGGFTDCLLQRGAARVIAVDVGYGTLAAKLRTDPRVDVRERINARELSPEIVGRVADLAVIDVSFINLGKVVPAVAHVLAPRGALVALVKPQFEAGREAASRGHGVIRDESIRLAAIETGRAAIIAAGFEICGEVDSAVPGPKGNVEHFVHARKQAALEHDLPKYPVLR